MRIYLHPKMVDFSKPVEIIASGKTVFNEKVAPDMKTMVELVREFDDRGRIFYAAEHVEIADDAEAPEPTGGGGGGKTGFLKILRRLMCGAKMVFGCRDDHATALSLNMAHLYRGGICGFFGRHLRCSVAKIVGD